MDAVFLKWQAWFALIAAVNGYTFFNYSCPSTCSCHVIDITTNCSGQDISELPDKIYLGVETLDLSRNNFDSIPDLSEYKSLKTLNLSSNKISTLTATSLDGLDALQILDLSRNLLKDWLDINPRTFSAPKRLSELYLSFNALGSFPELYNVLVSDSLKTLELNNCSIADLHDDDFSGLPALEELSMSKNLFGAVRVQIKHNSLNKLDMSGCRLKTVAVDALDGMTSLKHLILSNNYELKVFACRSTSLEILDLAHCNLDNVPTGYFPNLVNFSLTGNNLRRIIFNAFRNATNVQALDLSNTAISRIDADAFLSLDNLRRLDLSYNTISAINSKTFIRNLHLEALYISHNYLTKVPHFDIESLKYLDISSCEIREISMKSFSFMPILSGVNLSKNLISRLPDYIQGDSIQIMDLSMCHITSINNKTFAALGSLTTLNLAGNRLTTDVKSSYFPYLAKVYLEDNPWRCDCSTDQRDLFEWLNDKDSTLRCQSPEIHEGKTWSSACEEEWYPSKAHTDSMWWTIPILIMAVIVFCCIIFSIRRVYQMKERRQQELEEQERAEARERLRRMREQQAQMRELENRNAPDPREHQRPPSYTEALRMATPHGSYSSLTGSRQSLSSNKNSRSSKETNRKSRRRKRKKEKGDSSSEEQRTALRQEARQVASGSESEPSSRPQALESDF